MTKLAEGRNPLGQKQSRSSRQGLTTLRESALEDTSPSKIPKFSCTPTPALRHTQSLQTFQSPTPIRTRKLVSYVQRSPARKVADEHPIFLTKDAITPLPKLTSNVAWDTKGRLEDMETLYTQLSVQVTSANNEKAAMDEALAVYKERGGCW